MAELRLLTARQLRQVYRERVRFDFPPSERRPLASMERLRAAGVYDTWGMYEGEELLAYAFLWRSEAYGVALLDYLAVCREGRGRGTGTLALSLLQARYGDCSLLVEAEAQEEGVPPEENALRARRLSFYERSGFRRLGYQTRIFGVQYAMLVWPEETAAEPERLQDAHRGLYRSQLPNPLFRRVIHIPEDEH